MVQDDRDSAGMHRLQTQPLSFLLQGCRHFRVYVSRFALGHRPSEGPLFLSLFWFLCVKNWCSGSWRRQACTFSKSESCRVEHRFTQIKFLLSEFQWACSFFSLKSFWSVLTVSFTSVVSSIFCQLWTRPVWLLLCLALNSLRNRLHSAVNPCREITLTEQKPYAGFKARTWLHHIFFFKSAFYFVC